MDSSWSCWPWKRRALRVANGVGYVLQLGTMSSCIKTHFLASFNAYGKLQLLSDSQSGQILGMWQWDILYYPLPSSRIHLNSLLTGLWSLLAPSASMRIAATEPEVQFASVLPFRAEHGGLMEKKLAASFWWEVLKQHPASKDLRCPYPTQAKHFCLKTSLRLNLRCLEVTKMQQDRESSLQKRPA